MLLIIFSILSYTSGFIFEDSRARQLWFMTSAGNWSCGIACELAGQMEEVKLFFNKTGSNAGYGTYERSTNTIYIIFRGTEPWYLKNLVDDLDFIKVDYPYCSNGCQIHRGFYLSGLNLLDQVKDYIDQKQTVYEDAKLVIAGHSLGASIGAHMAIFLKNEQENYKLSELYTFGLPRLGDAKFAEWYDSQIDHARITKKNDPMIHLPPQSFEFKHIKTEIYYNGDQYKICNDSGEDESCSNKDILLWNFDNHLNYMGFDMQINQLHCL